MWVIWIQKLISCKLTTYYFLVITILFLARINKERRQTMGQQLYSFQRQENIFHAFSVILYAISLFLGVKIKISLGLQYQTITRCHKFVKEINA